MVKKFLISIIILCAVVIVYMLTSEFRLPDKLNTKTDNRFFINPVIVADMDKHFIINFQPLRNNFAEIQKKYPQKTYIYFVYLNNAAWVGINERELFTTASLIKVPLAMSVYKAIEEGKLSESAEYTLEEINLNPDFGDLYKNENKDTFTIKQLVEIMLTFSDNTAANALFNILNRIGISDPLQNVYGSMGWDIKELNESSGYGLIHTKILSNMFLSLYNSAYLKPDHSGLILKYLSESEFSDEIVSGIPKDIFVSHKIGIYDKDQTFSDCGIVYAPKRDFILCLASTGKDKSKADDFMKEISETAYDYVMNN